MRAPLKELAELINYAFNDTRLLQLAMTHRSRPGTNNERLEFLGDAILDLVISEWLYKRFRFANEGQMSRLRAAMVKTDTLAEAARALELGKYMYLSVGEQRSGGHSRDSTLADAFEALIAAIYLDGSYAEAERFIKQQLNARFLELNLDDSGKDPKTRLQEYVQERGLRLPVYTVLEQQGEQHNQHFLVQCSVEDLQLSSQGEGSSRRKGEQAAAEKLLQVINASNDV